MESESEASNVIVPFLRRADELQKEEPLVAFYCRLYAMEMGLKTTTPLPASLMSQLEKDNKSVSIGPGDSLYVEGFASNVFARADEEDRLGRADLNTAKTFHAASMFFEVLTQFGELQPDIEQKLKYAVWKAADITKAIKEGRRPEPGPPGGESSSSSTSSYDLGPNQSFSVSFSVSKPGTIVPAQQIGKDIGRSSNFITDYPDADLSPPSKKNNKGEWADLFSEILPLITQHLDLADFIRFRAICKSWRLSSALYCHHRPSLWAVLPEISPGRHYPVVNTDPVEPTTKFLSYTGPCVSFSIAIPSDHHCIGTGYGWLIIAHISNAESERSHSLQVEVYLYNPVTSASIPLPAIKRTEHLSLFIYGFKCVKAVISSHPSSDHRSVVIFRHIPQRDRSEYRQIIYVSRHEWDSFNVHTWLVDVAFHLGKLYVLSSDGEVYYGDFTRRGITIAPEKLVPVVPGLPREPWESGNLVNTPWGDLINIVGISPYKPVRVTRLNFVEKRFVDVEDGYLENHVVLLGVHASHCLSARDFPQLKRNCVYYVGNFLCVHGGYGPGYGIKASLGIYRIGDNESESLGMQLSRWPPPIFFLPSRT